MLRIEKYDRPNVGDWIPVPPLYTFLGKSHPFPGLLLTTPDILLRFASLFRLHYCTSDIDSQPSPGQPLLDDFWATFIPLSLSQILNPDL